MSNNLQWTLPYNGKRIFIVEMLRWGNDEGYSYIIGSWSDYEIAEAEAKIHMIHRGGKYNAVIHESLVDGDFIKNYRIIETSDIMDDEDDLENIIKSRIDWIKYNENS